MFQEHLEQTTASARARTSSFALLMIDLDRFKEINDTFGHRYGDAVLQQMNPRLRNALRKSDIIARLGGDEFAALLPDAEEADAVSAAERILEILREPIVFEGQTLDIGASIGIAVYPNHGEDPVKLMQRADVAMYAAKRVHGGYALSSPDHAESTPHRLTLISELRQGIENDQLLLHYQPKFDLEDHAGQRCGGVDPLAAPPAGVGPAGSVHPLGGADRAHQAPRHLDPSYRPAAMPRLA